MKVWNVSDKTIEQFYNSKAIIIKPNSILDVNDAAGLFLLNKREVRGQGLVELKDGDNKANCYKQGRKQIYEWAQSKYSDYERHCEEREAQRLLPNKPHLAIINYKAIIDDYEKWVESGEPVKEEYQEIVGEKRIFVCPHCLQEFSNKADYFGHLPLHSQSQVKEKVNANIGVVSNTGQGKG